MSAAAVFDPGERLEGTSIYLRLVTLDDCTSRYVGWLQDDEVNAYLETRRAPQTLDTVRAFVSDMLASPVNHLFAVVQREDDRHVGNIKLGPVRAVHGYADVSYFIGDRACWGRGYATEAIVLAADFGFTRLGLHRVQAGCYDGNRASLRALEKAGLRREGTFREQLLNARGEREDCHRYAILRSEWLDRQKRVS